MNTMRLYRTEALLFTDSVVPFLKGLTDDRPFLSNSDRGQTAIFPLKKQITHRKSESIALWCMLPQMGMESKQGCQLTLKMGIE
jgi:hypothetical protein